MTGPEITEACDRFIASDQVQIGLSGGSEFNTTRENLVKWLRFAFEAGAKAKADKLRWSDLAVETERIHAHGMGVLL